MKHLTSVSKERPNTAFEHPPLDYSLSEFFKNPIEVIAGHLKIT